MKILKFLLYAIIILIILVFILSFIAPTDVDMERSIEIEAPITTVWEHTNSLEDQHKWSPWSEKDPNITIAFAGTEGSIGSVYTWEGNEEVGKGEQEITAIDAPNRIDSELRFKTPYESTADAYVKLEEISAGKTKATYGFHSESSRPMNFMNLFLDFDELIGGDFEKGVANLKELVESTATNPTSEIKIAETQDRNYMSIRNVVKFADLSGFFAASYGQIMPAIPKKGLTSIGVPSAIYHTFDSEKMETDVAAVMPVNDAFKSDGEIQHVLLPASKVVTYDYYGPYDQSESAHIAIDEYMKKNNLTLDKYVLEEYVTDPGQEKDPNKWLTRITYYIK